MTVCYNTPHLIRLLLQGVERARFAFPFEYFLVDNGNDGTAQMVRERFPWVTVIEPKENIGFGRANNLAIQQAKGEYIMLVNPDLTIFAGEMEKLVQYADANPAAAIIGPRVENPDGSRQESCTREPTPLIPLYRRTLAGRTPQGQRAIHAYFMRDVDHNTSHHAPTVYGAAMLIRRQALATIGTFDERFFMYYEDVDLCRRAREAQWEIHYAPVARFVHYHQRESRIHAPWELITNRLARTHVESGVKYFLKWRTPQKQTSSPAP